MRLPNALMLVWLIGLAATTPTASAAEGPPWSAPQQLSPSGVFGQAGVDATGRVLATWVDQRSGTVFSSTRPSPSSRFSGPVALAQQPALPRRLEVNEAGRAVLLFGKPDACPNSILGCAESLFIRVGRSDGRFGAAEPVTDRSAGPPALALSEAGHVALAWQTEPVALRFLGTPPSELRVALRAPNGRLTRPETLSELDPDTSARNPSIAINARGDAIVAWEEKREGSGRAEGVSILASYRPAGGSFGRPDTVWNFRVDGNPRSEFNDGYFPQVAIDPAGAATLLFDADGKRVASRPRGRRFGAPTLLARSGAGGELLVGADGDQVAFWSGPFEPTSFATRRSPGGVFSPVTRLAGEVLWSYGGLDAHANLLLVGTTPPPEQRLVAGVYSRFGFAPQSFTAPPAAGSAGPQDLATNGAGAATALYTVYSEDFKSAQLMYLDRPADRSPPALTVARVRTAGRRISANVTCDEGCRVSAALNLPGSRRALSVRSPNSERTLRKGATTRLSARLSPSGRARLREVLGRNGRARIRAVVRAEDASGNVRRARRHAAARSLLR
jgi:hypothetical protein